MSSLGSHIVGDAIDAITQGAKEAVAGSTLTSLKPSTTATASALNSAASAALTALASTARMATSTLVEPTSTILAASPSPVAEAAHAAAGSGSIPDGNNFVWAYIHAHQTHPNDPSYRYAYLFWIVLFCIASAYAIAHHMRLSGGVVGAYFNRWGMKRMTVRYGPKKSGRSFILPSNSYMLTMGIVMFAILMLCLVGPDHIPMGTPVFWGNGSSAHAASAPVAKRSLIEGASHYKRAYDDLVYKAELIRPKHHDRVDKSLWSAGNRFGFMAFAVMPLIVAMALKSGPFGFFTNRFFTALHWDKVGTFHRAGGWFVWWLVTIHVILWTMQLWKDNYDGRAMWLGMLIAVRFRAALFAYFCMTAAMVTSLRWIRNRVYELFYLSHVVFLLLAFIFAIVHHHVIGYWIGICLILWAGDRFTRWGRTLYINGGFGSSEEMKSNNPFHDKYEEHSASRIVEIPAGYAQAQVLPSKTVRLSIRTHRPMKWAPGQSLLLSLPELSQLTTHPFSIANNDPNEIVLIIKARKGATLDLYNLVLERTRSSLNPADKRKSILPKAAPVHIKARVDGPMGSAGRVPWTDYSNILIVCGGSGVTFGLAICDHLSALMSQPGFAGSTRRIRFVWIVREYAEITWAASALCRFRTALSNMQLEINIYVTNGEKSTKVNRQRKNLDEDISDDESDRGHGSRPTSFSDYEAGVNFDEQDIRGLTHYAGEEDYNDSKDRRLSNIFQQEGKLRRLHSRQSVILQTKHTGFGNSLAVPAMPAGAAKRVSDIKTQEKWQRLRAGAGGGLSPIAGSPLSSHPTSPTNSSPSVSPTDTYPPPSIDSNLTLNGGVNAPFNPYGDIAGGMAGFGIHSIDELNYKAFTSRTQDMVLLEETPDAKGKASCMSCGHCEGESLWIDDGDYTAAKIMSECARTGRPPLQKILQEEMAAAQGRTIIATCGPVGLNTQLRNLVSSNIDTNKIRSGDPSGYVTMYSEDFEM